MKENDGILRRGVSRVRGYWDDLRSAYAADRWRGVTRSAGRHLRHAFLRQVGRGESERALIAANQRYWTAGREEGVPFEDYSHWLGFGPWKDRDRWLKLGQAHFGMFERLCLVTGTRRPVRRIVEWGSGGGANAIHFIREAEEFCGVEISDASLKECQRVLSAAGYQGFVPVLIRADAPEQALTSAGTGFDFFLSTYVFETLPTRSYGERVLRVALGLLRPGGLALVQIRYDDGSSRGAQQKLDYFRHAYRFTSYRVEEFWKIAAAVGFRPEYVTLIPDWAEGFSGDLYAYFALVKPDPS